MLDGLAWDEEESTTRESIRALRSVPRLDEVAPPSAAVESTARRDTIVELDDGPSTDRAPSTQSSAKVDNWLTNWDDGDPTHPQARERAVSDIVGVESAAPASIVPESAIRRSSDRHPKSTPLPVSYTHLTLPTIYSV